MDAPRRKIPYTFTCLHCGKTVETYPSRTGQQFCSRACSKAHSQKTVSKTCLGCGKSFTLMNARRYKLYCSQQCYFEHRKRLAPSKPQKRIRPKPQTPKQVIPRQERIPVAKFIERTCVVCGTVFQARRYANKSMISQTCSMKCRISKGLQTKNVAPLTHKVCKNCGKEFTVPKKQDKPRTMYCSNACRIVNMPKGKTPDPANTEIRPCLECGKPITVMKCLRNRKKYCSHSCSARYRTRINAIQSPTSIEVKLYQALDVLRVRYTPQYGMGRFVADAWLPGYNTIIEADGTYWHSLPARQERDKKLAAYAKRMNYSLIRLDEQFIKSVDIQGLAQHIKQQLTS